MARVVSQDQDPPVNADPLIRTKVTAEKKTLTVTKDSVRRPMPFQKPHSKPEPARLRDALKNVFKNQFQ
jgi:hypothetical protein